MCTYVAALVSEHMHILSPTKNIYIYIYTYMCETSWYSGVTNYLLKHCISYMITKLLYS